MFEQSALVWYRFAASKCYVQQVSIHTYDGFFCLCELKIQHHLDLPKLTSCDSLCYILHSKYQRKCVYSIYLFQQNRAQRRKKQRREVSVCYICANFIWKLAFNLCKNITQMHTMLSKLYRPMDKRCMQMDWYFCKILVLRCKMVATKSIPKAISAVYPFDFSPIVPHPHSFASTTTNICMNEHRCHSRACVALYDTNHRF